MSEAKDESTMEMLTAESFEPPHITILPEYFRQLIKDLQALPNVSDLAIIKTISELDRIAGAYERAQQTRNLIFAAGFKLAEKWVEEKRLPAGVLVLMKATGGLPPEIYQQVMDDVCGERAVHPTCDCPRCTARREAIQRQGGSATVQ